MMKKTFKRPGRRDVLTIIAIYVIFSGAWIYLSDSALVLLIQDQATIMRISIFKGFAFILVTSILLYQLVNRFILESRQLKEGLQKSDLRFSLLYEKMMDAFVSVDMNGRLLRFNEVFREMLGYSQEELLSLNQGDLTPSKWHDMEGRIIAEQVIPLGYSEVYEKEYRRKDGTVFPVELRINLIRDEERIPSAMWAIIRDITERKAGEKALQESQQRLNFHVDNSPMATIEWDADFNVTRWAGEAEKIFGWTKAETVGKPIMNLDIIYEEDIPIVQRTMNQLTDGSSKYVVSNNRNYTKDRKLIACEWYNTVLTNAQGQMISVLSQVLDITERKQAEEQIEILNTDLAARAVELENANHELETFNYTVSHDLRRPLTVISGYSQVIQELCGNNLSDACQQYLQEIETGTQRMSQLIDALLKFSSLMHSELHREDVDLSMIANAVATELAMTEPGRQVTFMISEGINANGDANLLRVVLENLLGNAWKYTGKEEDSVIEFGTMEDKEDKGIQTYFIRDNGTGFDMAHSDKLFMPFQRIHMMDFEGYGIGLSTVERIIKRHGGKIRAQGEPGKGAIFYFTL